MTDAELEADPAEAVRLVAGMVRRGEGGEAFRERRRVLSWSATEAGLLSPSYVEERGTAARIRRGRETLLVARSGTSLDSLREAVREASRRAGTSPFFKALRRPGPPPKHEPAPIEESEEARTAALASALAHAVPDPRGLSISLVLSHVSVTRAVVTPRALHSLGSSARLEAAGTIVGGGHERPFAFQSPLPFPAAAAALSHALHEATRPVPRFPAAEGEADIVFSSSAASAFWHEAVGHPLEAEGPERASVLARVRGAAVAPPGLDVVDDPRRTDLAGTFALDDEGVIATPVTLLHDGHVGDVLTDRRTAGEASNGHGRTSDYRRPPRVRMSNLVVSKGHAKLHDLFAECGTGIFVREISAGSADPESGRFVLVVEHAELLRRGRVAGALTRFALVGDLLVALSNLFPERGDEALPAVGLGLCVKGGDGVAVGGAAPAMLIRGLHVRGSAPVTGFYDDGLFGKLFTEAQREEHGPGHSVELYERAGASLELLEDEEGVCVSEAKERGFALRLFRGGRVGFAAAGPEGLGLLLPRARSLLPRARVRRGARAATPLAGEPPSEPVTGAPNVPDEAAAREILVDFRRAVTRAGGGAVAVREASVVMGERRERIATSGGREASWTSRAASLIAHLAGRAKEGRFSARVVANAARAEELPIARLARLGVDRVLLPLTGHAAPTGRIDVLLDSHVAAHLVGRLAPFFFGDAEDALLASRTRGGKDGLTSPVLSLVDDIAAPGGPIRIPRDGEGTPKRRTVVVERGMVSGRLTDVASAVRRDTTSSGNAIRRLWSEPPAVGVTNFFVDPSPGVSPLDLLASVTKGVYAAVLLERPDVDLAADRFRLVTAGYTIEKGRAAHRVSETVLSGRLSELLRGIASIGDDLKFVAGAGGGVGSPTLYIPRWKLG